MQIPEPHTVYQVQLARYCRSGTYPALPGVRKEGIQVYRDLILGAMKDIMIAAFPLSAAWLGDALWLEQIQDFMRVHSCQNAQFWRVPEEFFSYMEPRLPQCLPHHAALKDLLRMELVEWTLFLAPDSDVQVSNTGFWKEDLLTVHPDVRLILLDYPVHRLPAADISDSMKGSYVLLAHRGPDWEIRFSACSLWVGTFLDILMDHGPRTLNDMINQLRQVWGSPLSPDQEQELQHFIPLALEAGILGTRSPLDVRLPGDLPLPSPH